MRRKIYLSHSKRGDYGKMKLLKVITISGLLLIEPSSEAHSEEVQGTLVRRMAGKDLGLPYTELKICPAAKPGAKCVSVFTGPSGRFSVELDPGRYSVTVTDQAKRQAYGGQIDVVKGKAVYPKIVIKP